MSRSFDLHLGGKWIGKIARSSPLNCAPHDPERPWMLLHRDGRIDRFASLPDARSGARRQLGGALRITDLGA